MKEKSSRPNDMGACVSHGHGGAGGDGHDSASSSCRLRAQSQGSVGPDSTAGTCRLRSQSQGTGHQPEKQPGSPQKRGSHNLGQAQQGTGGKPQRQVQRHGLAGRSRRDNFCLWWCCCCKCSHKCLANVGQGNAASLRPGGDYGVDVGLLAELLGGELGNELNHELDKISMEEIQAWGESFDRLMRSPVGRTLFKVFCVSEYSDENIAFWLACEQLKNEQKPDKIEERARTIYDNYISIISPKEVSLDSRVRDIVNRNMTQPTPHTFDEAQLQIYTLMHRDSYPRFINSEIYRRVARLGHARPFDNPASAMQDASNRPLEDSVTNVVGTDPGPDPAPATGSLETRKSKKSIT
ncbi:regulator of G-protein signaling 17 [Copidosoma floridanum]|uniref:regulator of G-protein signaling 17 n=1 Tax=Copidosoma floridanum TaxID=29053 RepID=UPI0006C9723D|nr:regulator of G-protein signaling 17 [Copidosoma floridanum]